jgi:RNA polymerase sigma factor (TIGR02999 family)
MVRDSTHDVTQLLEEWGGGNKAALDQVIDLVYEDLCRIAHRHLGNERAGHTLDTRALVHESYLRIAGHQAADWDNRGQFFAMISQAMRRVLVDHARRRRALKRGGDPERIQFSAGDLVSDTDLDEMITLDDALAQLEENAPRLCRVVECRFFGGMTVAETAEALGISQRSVERDWTRARTYLYRSLEPAHLAGSLGTQTQLDAG